MRTTRQAYGHRPGRVAQDHFAATAQLQFDYGQRPTLPSYGGLAEWFGAGVWLTYAFAPSATLAIRGDYMNDPTALARPACSASR